MTSITDEMIDVKNEQTLGIKNYFFPVFVNFFPICDQFNINFLAKKSISNPDPSYKHSKFGLFGEKELIFSIFLLY